MANEPTAILNGVTVTKSQLEAALKEINSPEFKAGDIVFASRLKKKLLLVSGTLAETLEHKYGKPYASSIRVTDGESSWLQPINSLTLVMNLED